MPTELKMFIFIADEVSFNEVSCTSKGVKTLVVRIQLHHTCDKFQRGIREVFLSFPGGF